MLELETVLCPTDFSSVGDQGVDLASQVCQRFGSRLVIQYNIDTLPPLYLAGLEAVPQTQLQLDQEQKARADQLLQQLISNLPSSIRAEGRITKGQAAGSILHVARELRADLIVMGTHGRSGFGHVIIGSTTERVLVQAPCAVLAVRDAGESTVFPNLVERDPASVQQVLVPIDFSPHSLYTLEYAFRMADSLPISLNLLHVVEPISWDDMRGTTHFNVPEYQRYRMYEARQRLLAFIPKNMTSKTHAHVRIGPVVDEIRSYAEMIEARLIVMGTRPRGILDELFFGATSYGVLRSSKCPVWIVPGRRAEKRSSTESEVETVTN